MRKKSLILFISTLLLCGCSNENTQLYCYEFCGNPSQYTAANRYVLNVLKKEDNYTISRFKINSVDNKIYNDNIDGSDGIRLFVVRCSYVEDYYDNGNNINDSDVNFIFYLNIDCTQIFDINNVRAYLNKLSCFAIYYNYSSIDKKELFNGNKKITLDNASNYNLVEFPTFFPIINNKLDYSDFYDVFNVDLPNEKYFKDYIKFDMSLDELKEGFNKIKEDSLTYNGEYDLPIK